MNVSDFGDIVQESFIQDDKQDFKKHTKYGGQGIVSSLGLTIPAEGPSAPLAPPMLFITLSISPKHKIQLNKGTKRCWGDYTINEQRMIISRYEHFLKSVSDEFSMYFELTKQMNVHLHCIASTNSYIKDIIVLSKRFFSIPSQNKGFIDVRTVYDEQPLRDYLENKTEKKYQTLQGVKPIIYKKHID